nr:immunoglobulin heavy chain junction region [Macaca mulatta]MPN74465.1 immunoglobulin heavy chain junction region [Macaca mulatta]
CAREYKWKLDVW